MVFASVQTFLTFSMVAQAINLTDEPKKMTRLLTTELKTKPITEPITEASKKPEEKVILDESKTQEGTK